MAFVDATAVQVALPAIGRDLGASLSGLQWTISGYTLALASLILLGGSLGDRYGRRRVFLVGVVWFAVASLICGLAQTTGQLVAARVLQGIGGALLTPGSLALIQSSFRPADRARAIGLWSALAGIAGLIGPFLGGLLVDAVSWRLVFLLNVPVAALDPRRRRPARAGEPGRRGRTAASTSSARRWAPSPSAAPPTRSSPPGTTSRRRRPRRRRGRGSRRRSASSSASAGRRDPMLPLGLFADRQFTGANLATFAVYGALGGDSLFLVLQLQTVLGYDATAAGAAMLPAILLITLLSPRAGALAARIGPRLPMTVGPLVVAAGTLLLVRVDGGGPYVLEVLPGSLLQGLGMAITVTPLTATVLAAAPDAFAGIASGVNNASARAAQLLAVAALPVAVGLSGTTTPQPLRLHRRLPDGDGGVRRAFAVGGAAPGGRSGTTSSRR